MTNQQKLRELINKACPDALQEQLTLINHE